MITREELVEKYHYDALYGIFYYKNKTDPSKVIGSNAGCKTKIGYITICINGKRYAAHRLAILWLTGKFPEGKDVHHKNKRKNHNIIPNLECITRSCHKIKHRNWHNNICIYKTKDGYTISKTINGRHTYIGHSTDILIARSIRDNSLK